MIMMRSLLAVAVASLLLTGVAQSSGATAEDAVRQAVGTLNGSSFHFSYSLWPGLQATSPVSGEGDMDRATQSWRYIVQAAADDPGADRSRDGEWVMADGTMYYNDGSGWVDAAMDFTYLGVTGAITPFESYEFASMLASPDGQNLEPLEFVGREVVNGLEADHYRFATDNLPVLGTGEFNIWISQEGESYSRIILQVTTADGHKNRVAYSNIGVPVSIAAPSAR
jgi:hypothetical protein